MPSNVKVTIDLPDGLATVRDGASEPFDFDVKDGHTSVTQEQADVLARTHRAEPVGTVAKTTPKD